LKLAAEWHLHVPTQSSLSVQENLQGGSFSFLVHIATQHTTQKLILEDFKIRLYSGANCISVR